MMTKRLPVVFSAVICAVALSNVGCGQTVPTTAPSSLLRIDSVAPTGLQPSPLPQTLTVTGLGFTSSVDVLLTSPDASPQSGPAQYISPTEIRADVILPSAGTYTLRIDELTSKTSVSTSIVVGPGQAQGPVLSSVSPGVVVKSDQSQGITLSGLNLMTAQQLQLSRPDGQSLILVPGQFTVVDDTLVTFSSVFDRAGTYSVVVTTPVSASNSVTITAN